MTSLPDAAPALAALLVLTLSAPLLGAALGLARRSTRDAVAGAGVGAVGALLLLASVVGGAEHPSVSAGSTTLVEADRLGAFLLVVVTATALVVTSYARRSLAGDAHRGRFLFVGAAALAGAATLSVAADLLVAVAAWVALSAATAALVAHGDRRSTRAAARRVAATFAVGDVALVAAAAWVVVAEGPVTLRPDALVGLVPGGSPASAAVVLALGVVVAVVTRTALPPAQSWLPASIAAPTPASAMLHAGLVGSGAVLLVRTAPVVGEVGVAVALLVLSACAGVAVGTAVLRTRPDVKSALAWSTVAQMGFVVLQVTVGLAGSAVLHMAAHGFYKTHQFLGSGSTVATHHGSHDGGRPASAAQLAGAAATSVTVVAVAWRIVGPDLPGVAQVVLAAAVAALVGRVVLTWIQRRAAVAARPDALDAVALVALGGATVALVAVTSLLTNWLAPSLPVEAPALAAPAAAALALTVAGGVLLARLAATGRGGRAVDVLYMYALDLGDPGRLVPVAVEPLPDLSEPPVAPADPCPAGRTTGEGTAAGHGALART